MAKVSNKNIKYICRSNPCESNMLEILFQAVFLFLVCDDVTEKGYAKYDNFSHTVGGPVQLVLNRTACIKAQENINKHYFELRIMRSYSKRGPRKLIWSWK